jgi:hypothetical protein
MTITYLDAIDHLYGTSPFTVRDFATRVANRRAGKLLSDLKRRGFVARVGRGTYRRLEPAERPDLRRYEWERVRRILLNGPNPKAWAGANAVEVWTDGAYRSEPSIFARVYRLSVPRASVPRWRKYLRRHGLSDARRKRIGPRIELIPVDRLRVTFVGDEPVPPRSDVVRLIRNHPALFAHATELLVDRS